MESDLLLPPAELATFETNATHVFIVKDGVVMTSTTASCPEGVTRGVVLEICAAEEIPHEVRNITLEEVHGADEVFCTGTMGELAAVTTIDGHVIGDGAIGPLTRRLSKAFAARTAVEGVWVVE